MLARSQTRRVYMKFAITSVRMLLLSVCISGAMFAKDPAKAIAHDTKEAAAATGKAAGRGARDVAKGAEKGSREVAHGTAKTAEEAGHVVKKAGKETGKGREARLRSEIQPKLKLSVGGATYCHAARHDLPPFIAESPQYHRPALQQGASLVWIE
jgi:hypothetical protein